MCVEPRLLQNTARSSSGGNGNLCATEINGKYKVVNLCKTLLSWLHSCIIKKVELDV